MFDNAKNSKIKGTVGIGKAIQYFTQKGMVVSLPINDSQSYDLVVDFDGSLQRIQVKTSAVKINDSWDIALRTTGGNQSRHTAKNFDKTSCDYLFILVDSGQTWLIPTKDIDNKTYIRVGKNLQENFEVTEG